jgi:hypothetical protein
VGPLSCRLVGLAPGESRIRRHQDERVAEVPPPSPSTPSPSSSGWRHWCHVHAVISPPITASSLPPLRFATSSCPRADVFAIDALNCPWCGGQRRLIALLTDGLVVRHMLAHLGLPTEPPLLAPARAPPEPAFDW